MSKLTIKELLDAKGKRQLTQVLTFTEDDARACEEAGIDMIITPKGDMLDQARRGAPNTFVSGGLIYGSVASKEEAIRAGFEVMRQQNADAVYAFVDLDWVRAMSRNGIPVVGHVGLIPHTCSYTGGFKAVGKTADQALQVYRDTLAWQEAGALGVEFEVVPYKIAAEIARRVEILIISMGAGASDVQYLFGCDIFGSSRSKMPRHAKTYADVYSEMQRIYQIKVDALKAYKDEVDTGAFPPPECVVEVNDDEFEKFMDQVDKV